MIAPATTLDMPAGSFQALLESAWNGALRWARRLTGDEADAEDLRQDAALRA
jgi:DNA-directed RNA polymerase specialized sigma24 family protein